MSRHRLLKMAIEDHEISRSLDILDSLSDDTKIDMIGTSIIRVLPRLNEVINES